MQIQSKMSGSRKVAIASLALAAVLLSGCANRNSIIVGSIPDDYRTRHPIVIAEKERVFDLPVASGDTRLTVSMRETVRGVAYEYRSGASGAVRIMVPTGTPNAGAAAHLVSEVKKVLSKDGVPVSRIITTPYQVAYVEDAAPIRISFMAITASTEPCGRWPEDLLQNTHENRQYENFGCATQSNLAAQIANPADLLSPRGMTPIDATRRANAIEAYRKQGSDGSGGED